MVDEEEMYPRERKERKERGKESACWSGFDDLKISVSDGFTKRTNQKETSEDLVVGRLWSGKDNSDAKLSAHSKIVLGGMQKTKNNNKKKMNKS